MSTVDGICECQVCGGEATYQFDTFDYRRVVWCPNPDCDTNLTDIQKFKKALGQDDFAVGDSFWIEDFEFEVITRR